MTQQHDEEAVLPVMPAGHPGLVYILMGQVLAELPAIGKNRENTEQRFMYRGYDDVLNALNPLLSEHGLFLVPDVIERISTHRITRQGGTMYEVNLHVRFTVYAADGSSVSGTAWGEGTDMGDKATAKAMTNALKYWLFQTFAISTQEASEADADRYTPDLSDPDETPCPHCNEVIEGTRSSVEPMRQHLVEKHGWVRLPDDRVAPPGKVAAAVPSDEQAPATASEAAPAAMTDDPDEDAAPAAPPEDDDELAWVDDLKGDALTDKCRDLGLSTSGTAPEKRQRIKDFIMEPPADAEPEPAPTGPKPGGDRERFSGPELLPLEQRVTAEALVEIEAANNEADPEVEYPCDEKGCDHFPFNTEREYYIHWYTTHDPDRPTPEAPPANNQSPDPAATDDVGDDPAAPASSALIARVQARMGKLKGDTARAYGKYRRDHGIGAPDTLTHGQAIELLAFFDEQGVPAA